MAAALETSTATIERSGVCTNAASPGILLAALLVSLCGCTSVFDKEYLSVRPYEEPSNLLTDADTTQIRNYAGLMRALNTMAAQYERSFVLAFGDYDRVLLPTIWPPPARSCAPAPPRAYCIESVSYETEQVIAYCEASITITYNRPENEVRSIYSAQTQKSILDCVVDALDRQRTQFAIQISTSTLEPDDVTALVRSACLNQPQLVVNFPVIRVEVYSGGSSPEDLQCHAAVRRQGIHGQRPPHAARRPRAHAHIHAHGG